MSSKQTAEQAAQLHHDKTVGHATDDTLLEDFTERDREQEYILTFLAGSAWQREQGIEWLLSHLPSEDSGRAGCYYGDTEYDSLTVVYGYNLALQHVREQLEKLKTN